MKTKTEVESAMPDTNPWLARVSLLWAGMVVGGSLIAAPAKFQVEELTMPVALMVGREQFGWLAIAEGILIAIGVLGSWFIEKLRRSTSKKMWLLFLFALSVFAIQHLILMPQLQQRSARIIAGENVDGNSLHLVYVAAECMKVLVLIVIGNMTPPILQRP